MESLYEYGSRVGFWRIHKLFKKYNLPLTIFGVGMALERNPEICKEMKIFLDRRERVFAQIQAAE